MQDRIPDWINDLFSDFEESHPLWNGLERCLEPLIDLSTTEDEIIVSVDLPLVRSKQDILLNVSERSIDIKAIMCKTVRWERWGTVQKDVDFNSYRKVIRLLDIIDPSMAKAKFNKGILTVTLPKVRKKVNIKID